MMACAISVAVVVPSPATSLVLVATSLHQLRAHVFKGVFQLDLLGDGHTVVGDERENRISCPAPHCCPLGPRVIFDRICQLIDAAFEGAACVLPKLSTALP